MATSPVKEHTLKKKFYRDFTEKEIDLLEELQDIMARCYIFIPPFVVRRMIDRGIIPDVGVLDNEEEFVRDNLYLLNDLPEYKFISNILNEGIPYEFSNEGVSNPISPYRIVWAGEFMGFTYFVKFSVPPARGGVRVVDVWRKQGGIPFSPLREQRQLFAKGVNWDISMILARILDSAKAEVGE